MFTFNSSRKTIRIENRRLILALMLLLLTGLLVLQLPGSGSSAISIMQNAPDPAARKWPRPASQSIPIKLARVPNSPLAQLIVDGGFETGGIPNTFWNPETSTNFGTPVCDVPNCGTGGGASPPRTGAFWAWFGGIPAPETATLGQTVTIPSGGTASLTFWMRIGTVSSPFTDVLNVRVDGTIQQSFPEPTVAEGAYTLRTINLNAFANGAAHAILFEYIGPTSGTGSYIVDDVELNTTSLTTADLSITKTDGVTTAVPGGSVTYTITASNAGPSAATGATVADTFPAVLTCTWTCVGAGGGTCTAAGAGNINDTTVNLPVGGSVTYTASCSIAASATGTLSNTATVTAPGGVTDPTPGNNSATDTDTLTPQANLGITKTDGVTTVTAGGSTTYTITASNPGPSNAPGSTVADTFPATLTCTWTCVGAGGGTCTASGSGNINNTVNLPAGGSVTYTASCSISGAASGSLSNTATVAAPGGVTDPTPGNNSATDTDTIGASADLAITKTDGVTTVTAGGSTTYTITASNAGPSNATGATVADTFPASLTCTWTCVGAGGGTCTASGSGNINQTVNLPAGGSVTYTASCSISGAASGSLSNTATVTAPGGVTDPTPGNNSATDTDTIGASADLSITKTDGVTTVTAGGSTTYTITASNAGPSNATGATVADTFPASLTCTWTCVGAGGGTCTASGSGNINQTVNLPAGGSVTYTASCSISGAASGSLSNTATVSAPGGVTDPTPGNNSATDTDTIGATADLSITKTDGVTTVNAGGSTTYTITASNAGPSNATGATVADTFPATLTCTWTCVGAGGGTCTAAGSGNIGDTVNLPAGGSVTYTASCTISPSATGTLSNTATVSSTSVTDPTPGNNSATDSDTIIAQADLSITKTDGVTTAVPGQSVTYTITASNPAGSLAVPSGTVTDTFPATLTCTWTCVGAGGGTCTAAGSGNINNTVNLPPGGSVTYTATCSIAASATGTLSNTATVSGGAVPDPNPGNNSATDTDTLTPRANLGITKTDGVMTVAAGGMVTYTIVASNAGPSNVPGAMVTDTFPAVLTGVTWTCVGAGGGTCTAAGSGNINQTVNLPVGGSVTFTATGTLSPGASGTLSNTASVRPPAGVLGLDDSNDDATDTDTILALPDLSITKTDGTGTATAGSTVTYTIVASNSAGSVGVTGATVTDNFPAGLANVTWTCVGAGGGTCPAGGTGNINATVNLPAGASVTFTATGTVVGNVPGTISNTATVAAPAGVTDSNPANNSATDTDTIVCPTVTLSPATLPNATINTAYPTTITASPAGGNYTFAVTSGLLPAGLSLNSNGSFSGAPTQSGVFNFRITATGFGSCTGFRDYVLTVDCQTITVNPASLPGGTIGTGYSQSVSASPAGSYSFAVTSGALPNGLSLNTSTGAITGTPTNAGTFTFTITASVGGCSGSRSYTVAIACAGSITLGSLSNPTAGVAYSGSIAVSPAGSYTFSLVQGNLPSGLTLNPSTGAITGLVTVAGTYNFTIKADAGNGCSGSQSYTLVVGCPTITISPATLPNGTTGTSYAQTVTAAPATGSYSFAVSSGSLPPGLALNASGLLSGTPTANGTFNFSVTATAFGNCTSAPKSYTITIGGGACPTITLPNIATTGSVGTLYNQSVNASPAGSYTYLLTSGAPPPGITFYAGAALLFGYPTTVGASTFTIKATSTSDPSCFQSKAYTITIGAGAFAALAQKADYDGDGKSDFALRSNNGTWRLLLSNGDSANRQAQTQSWGTTGDLSLLGDYDGDGQSDLAVFRPGNGTWYVKRSSDGGALVKAWGLATDVPVPGDYDGDGKTDIAVWRGSEGNWYIVRSSDGAVDSVAWGAAYAPYNDVAVPGDYDGDGQTDLAVFRRSTGTWLIKRSSDGQFMAKAWGLGSDVPVAADYDGDGKTDFAVWRSGMWYVWQSASNSYSAVEWGASAAPYFDLAVPGDYDGDGKADVAVWRPGPGMWYVRASSDGSVLTNQLGQQNDLPVMARRP